VNRAFLVDVCKPRSSRNVHVSFPVYKPIRGTSLEARTRKEIQMAGFPDIDRDISWRDIEGDGEIHNLGPAPL